MVSLRNKKHRRRNTLIILAAVALIAFGAWGFWRRHQVTHNPPVATGEVITYSATEPDETKPDNSYHWQGDANDPKKIIIPSLGVGGYIQKVGIDQSREMAVPDNVHLAGWFVDSVRPGEKGLSIIDGHLNGRDQDGIFAKLQNVQKDASYSIEFGDGSSRHFRVMNVQVVDSNKAAAVLFSQDPKASHQLNLITCGGTFDRQSRQYDKRVIVASELIN